MFNTGLIQTPLAVCSFPALFKAVNSPEYPETWKKKVTLMLPKQRADVVAFVAEYNATLEAMEAEFVPANDCAVPDTRAAQLKDGDALKRKGKFAGKVDPQQAGYWLLDPWAAAKDQLELSVIDAQGRNVRSTDEDDFYYGALVTASVQLFTYTKNNGGISLGLLGVCRRQPGQRLGGKPSGKEIWASMGLQKPIDAAAQGAGVATPAYAAKPLQQQAPRLAAPAATAPMAHIVDPQMRELLGLSPL